MDIQNIDEQQYVDILGVQELPKPTQQTANFTSTPNDSDILIPVNTTTDTTPAKTDDNKVDDNTDNKKDVDILADNKTTQPSFKDLSGYFEDRFKSGKFVAITEDKEDGSKVPFIPSTPEEYDEVIDIQVNYRLDQRAKEADEAWYAGKSQAWKTLSKYAEMTDNPADILPFLQGIKNIDSVSELNPEDLGHAEKIVRARLEQKGDDSDVIEQTIESLKTTDKLIATAQKYKPAMVNDEKANLSALVNQKRAEEQEYIKLVNDIRENAIKAIQAPIYGKHKMKQEEMAQVYDLIAEPSRETKGYPIYNVIDSLFEQGDFETLKQIALLAIKKESLYGYISASAADKTSEGIQKKLRVAGETISHGKDTYNETPSVQRNQYAKPTARFGR